MLIHQKKGVIKLKKTVMLIFVLMVCTFLTACNGKGNQFDSKVEQEKATKVMNSVLTSFDDGEKLAEAKTSDEANKIAWDKLKKKNIKEISNDLKNEDQRRLLYLLTTNQAKELPNGE